MNPKLFSEAMSEVSDKYYAEAANYRYKRRGWTRWGALAACLLLTFTLSVPALAAADFDPAYNLLYMVSPAIAQRLKPVSVSCQDNGIEFEVISAYVEGNEADIFVAVRDLEGDRIDAATDLFDSYRINTPFDCSSSCKIISHDAETKTAAFLISISQWNEQDITGKKVTFLVGEMLSNKQEYDVALPDLDAAAAPETVEPAVILGGGGRDYEEISAGFRALKPAGVLCSPVDGVDITAMGYVDGELHIQAKYGSASETGDHGYVYFKNAGGGELRCAANVAFSIDGERYEEYVFDLPDADLTGCELYGRFVTGGTHMTGNWSVTFPLESVSR